MPDIPTVSVIIPVLADGEALRRLLTQIHPDPRVEVVVSHARQPAEAAVSIADRPDVRLIDVEPGRAHQMNEGARVAHGRWLLFLHADSGLPADWLTAFDTAMGDAIGGWFRFGLDDPAWQARVIERAVALRVRLFRLPYGDQGFFVRRDIFESIGRYRELPLMEDVDFIRRLAAAGPVVEVPRTLLTSARRWRRDGWFRRSARNLLLVSLYFGGVPPARLARWYAR